MAIGHGGLCSLSLSANGMCMILVCLPEHGNRDYFSHRDYGQRAGKDKAWTRNTWVSTAS
jgi:hypothetical protein